MRCFFIYLAFCAWGLLLPSSSKAQLPDPTQWNYRVVNIGKGQYDLVFSLKLQTGWHIWSITPGGDGTLIAPTFTFKKHTDYQLVGTVKQAGSLKTELMEGIDGKVNFYSDSVTYTQHITAMPGISIVGTHEYQVCNNQMCLPPKDVDFVFKIVN